MPDISMCNNKECQSKDDCYRFTATPSEWQAWQMFDSGVGVCCESYIPNGNQMKKHNIQFKEKP